MSDISKLEVFSHGFFQDILTLMKVLDKDTITKTDIETYLKERLKRLENSSPVEKTESLKSIDFTKMRVSEKYKIFQEKNPDSDMTIEEFIKEIRAGRVPCKGCSEKEKAVKNGLQRS